SLQANLPEYPRISLTDEDGIFSFLGVSNNADFEIRSGLDKDYMNGVSTLDLVKIQRHILGLELLDSPYKVIAADINGDEKLKASDLLVLRKLILGIITDLPTNKSWRFVDKTQEFEDIYYPWPIQESIDMTSLQGDILNNDFIAVKIGDVNGNADPNFDDKAQVQTRDLQSIGFEVDDLFVSIGKTVEVTFVASENFDLRGYQFSMELDGLSFIDITSQSISIDDKNIGLIDRDLVTMSYNDTEKLNVTKGSDLFSISFLADKPGLVSEMIVLTSKLTVNEAYIGDAYELHEVELRFNEALNVHFENKLYQNEPNPFRKSTSISFDLATSSDVTLTLLNTTGAIVSEIFIDGKKGQNEYELEFDQIGVNGLYYYKIDSGEFSATKKMILLR
ncbi:MAG: hypothetical protein ACI9P5_004066, partial [Saprospiraceae bacterium]